MSDPIVDIDDLGTYLTDSTINQDRAQLMIRHAQDLCESILSPLPITAAVVVLRVAARGYVTATSARAAQLQAAGSPFGGMPATGSVGGVWLTRADKADLRRLSGGGGAFSIDILPTGYTAPPSWNFDPDDFNAIGTDWDSPV